MQEAADDDFTQCIVIVWKMYCIMITLVATYNIITVDKVK